MFRSAANVHSESRHFQTASGSRGQAARLTCPRCPKEARHGQQKVACSIQAQGLNHCRHPRARPGPSLPFPLRFPLAFDGKLLGQVVRIFTDTVASWYRRRHTDRGLPAGESGAVTVIQRANSDLRLNPHLHTIFLAGWTSRNRGQTALRRWSLGPLPSSRGSQRWSLPRNGISSDILASSHPTTPHAARSFPRPPSPHPPRPSSRTSPRTHRGISVGPSF